MTNPTETTPSEPVSAPAAEAEATLPLDELTARARQHAKSLVQDLEVLMRRYPLATVAVGLGLGYVIARLLHRR
jgi:ElaB/YqjD/DUF883 family membrane-anchored ribosome-binding protein